MSNKNAVEIINQLKHALEEAETHLDFIGWGDSYERECAKEQGLEELIEQALSSAGTYLKEIKHGNQNGS